MPKSQCYLLNLENNQHIILPHLTPVTLGRNKECNIVDTQVSRTQVICFSNLEEHKVIFKKVGKAMSGCNGLALTEDLVYTVGHKDIIEVRLGLYKFEVNFDPPIRIEETEASTTPEPIRKKARLEFPIFNTQNRQSTSSNKLGGVWEEVDNKELLIFTPIGCDAKEKIASFDIDGTIIKTKSGARFPKDANDWTWYLGDVKSQLSKLTEQEYKLVFFTNQSGVGNDISKIKDFKIKIENIVAGLGLPVQVFISVAKKMYRKPRTGMWVALVKSKNNGVLVDVSKSFYVGDAAGREKNWAPKRNKDHSNADRLFALNIGIKFYTPEEYFLKQKAAPFKMPEFDPTKTTTDRTYPDISYDKLNVVLMVGGPGSGKTSFVKNMLLPSGYIHVSRDQLGSWQKCVKVMEENLIKKRNVVIDNTNVDKDTRQRFVQAAVKLGADVRCFVMETSLAEMRHNNKFRELTDQSHAIVSDIIIFSYRKNYQEPVTSEGYTQILKIPFIVKFTDKSLEKFYRTYLLD